MGDEHRDGDTGQLTARQRVMLVFASLSVPPPLRRHPPGDDLPSDPPGPQRPYRDRRTGRFAARPEQPCELPQDDTILSLRDAQDAAAPKVGGAVAGGRDVTGEIMRTLRPVPRPEREQPHVREMTFPADRPIASPDGNPARWRRAWRRDRGR